MRNKTDHRNWPEPRLVVISNEKARPDRSSEINASEYVDTAEVLDEKITVLASLIQQSRHFVALTGAGISTAVGITDYASSAKGSIAIGKETKMDEEALAGNSLSGKHLANAAAPTLAHRVLAALEKKDLLKHWIYLNHDGLAQKTGYPKVKLNEIHGSWFDPEDNPVALTDDDLRPDLVCWLEEWEKKADLCLAMGTSLCGMKADRVAATVGSKQGLIIINLQRTPYDKLSVLRIFAPCDEAMKLLGQKLNLDLS